MLDTFGADREVTGLDSSLLNTVAICYRSNKKVPLLNIMTECYLLALDSSTTPSKVVTTFHTDTGSSLFEGIDQLSK